MTPTIAKHYIEANLHPREGEVRVEVNIWGQDSYSRIDYFIVDNQLLSLIPNSQCHSIVLSDHGPVQIDMIFRAPMTAVRTNGSISEYFMLHRGSRQGCCLSPYLIDIAIEHLAVANRSDNRIKGISRGDINHMTSLYADDLLLQISDPIDIMAHGIEGCTQAEEDEDVEGNRYQQRESGDNSTLWLEIQSVAVSTQFEVAGSKLHTPHQTVVFSIFSNRTNVILKTGKQLCWRSLELPTTGAQPSGAPHSVGAMSCDENQYHLSSPPHCDGITSIGGQMMRREASNKSLRWTKLTEQYQIFDQVQYSIREPMSQCDSHQYRVVDTEAVMPMYSHVNLPVPIIQASESLHRFALFQYERNYVYTVNTLHFNRRGCRRSDNTQLRKKNMTAIKTGLTFRPTAGLALQGEAIHTQDRPAQLFAAYSGHLLGQVTDGCSIQNSIQISTLCVCCFKRFLMRSIIKQAVMLKPMYYLPTLARLSADWLPAKNVLNQRSRDNTLFLCQTAQHDLNTLAVVQTADAWLSCPQSSTADDIQAAPGSIENETKAVVVECLWRRHDILHKDLVEDRLDAQTV
ncbi:hypothetical protein F2P81_007484 [Scophthalmus maximus]|uniref:Reverse transcriptase domain-containing protein n=1 Tax=Scophthalmus maximus TaxID=52904 RepID=A0A6A4T2U6_SCOMX|nr:hypothetical protein F2P81_007484 [Scophthalmus maximus]